jgi:cation transport ATPase
LQHFELEAGNAEQRQATVRTAQERPDTRQELEARVAAYREMGLSEQEAIADLKRQERQEASIQQRPVRRKTTGMRAFAETSAAIGVTALLMRVAGGLVLTLARFGMGHVWLIALVTGAACCIGIGYLVEAVVPRRAMPAILTILALYLAAFASEAAFYNYLSLTVLSILCAYTMASAGLGLAGARLRRRQRERRLCR